MKNKIYQTDDIKAGFKFRYADGDLWHVVALFRDGKDMVVIKSWAKYKRYWVYKVCSMWNLLDWLNR